MSSRKKRRIALLAPITISVAATLQIYARSAHAYELAEGCTTVTNATDKNVFNWRFYLNANVDVAAVYKTPQEACSHWLYSVANNEGRQAHAGFHSRQYLQRYADLTSAFGATNYQAAINHYVSNGLAENRIGYLENGLNSAHNRSTIRGAYAGSKIFVSGSSRMAGAVDSVMLDNKELINAYDHGRELQVALVREGSGECYNPTEAGSDADGRGGSTSSYLVGSATPTANVLSTTAIPAFWFPPGYAGQCAGKVSNTTVRADNYTIDKRVEVGYSLPNVLRFSTAIHVRENVPLWTNGRSITVEVPTGYLAGELNSIYEVNPTTGSTTDVSAKAVQCYATHSASDCNHGVPLVHTDAGKTVSVGVCKGNALGGNWSTPSYAAHSVVDSANPHNSTTKWNIHYSLQEAITASSTAPRTFNFETYVIVAKQANGLDALQNAKSTIQTLFQQGICTPI